MLASFDSPARFIRSDVGNMLFAWVLVMWFAPKIASFIDLLLRPEARRGFGGGRRIVVNFVIETVYSTVLCPILWISHTIFLAGLLFDREIGWIGQVRDDHAVSFRLALSSLWPQTLIGWIAMWLVSATQPAALPWFFSRGRAGRAPSARRLHIARGRRPCCRWLAGCRRVSRHRRVLRCRCRHPPAVQPGSVAC
jgi:membrane glycosyltransferase